MKLRFPIALSILLMNCAIPVSHANTPLTRYDNHTEYRIENRDDGFNLTVYLKMWQLHQKNETVATICKIRLKEIAKEHSDITGKPINYILESDIQLTIGRNDESAITSCQANAVVKWK